MTTTENMTAKAAREIVKARFPRAGVREFGCGRERFFSVQMYGSGVHAGHEIADGDTAKAAWLSAAARVIHSPNSFPTR